jgi:hypothetical protein
MRVLPFLIVLFCGGFLFISNAEGSGFSSVWENMLKVDDREKDFRFNAFLDSLQQTAVKSRHESKDFSLPNGWVFSKSSDLQLEIWAAVLPFQNQPSRLIWLMFDDDDESLPLIFTRTPEVAIPLVGGLSIELQKSINEDIELNSLKIKSGETRLVYFPDVEMKLLFDKLLTCGVDAEMESLSEAIWSRLSVLLAIPDLFNYDFNDYDKLSTLLSPDGKLKISTWNIEYRNGENAFYGGISTKTDNSVRVTRLTDTYKTVRSPEQASLTPARWYGAIYYEMIENRYRGETVYTLLGYNGNNPFSKIRVIEALTIAGNGTPRFANAIFTDDKRSRRRLIFEYSNRANMMLRYDRNQRMIVMDNLAPYDSMFENDPRYYGPDFTHNGLRFERGKWVLYNEIDLRNPAPPRRGN